MAEAVAELVNMARESDKCRAVAVSGRNDQAAWTDGMTAYLCMEAARRLAKRHGLPKPKLSDDPNYYMRITA